MLQTYFISVASLNFSKCISNDIAFSVAAGDDQIAAAVFTLIHNGEAGVAIHKGGGVGGFDLHKLLDGVLLAAAGVDALFQNFVFQM